MSDETSSPVIQPVLEQPPEQEFQTQAPGQLYQERSDDNPPVAGVSPQKAREGKSAKAAFEPTPATTIEEVLKAAYFVASGIDAPTVEVVNPHVINLHYLADGSLATIRVEGRAGAWGGIGPKGSLEEEAARNEHYDAMAAAAAAPPVEPPPPPPTENPVYEVQRQ
jgi:hypothetical protein